MQVIKPVAVQRYGRLNSSLDGDGIPPITAASPADDACTFLGSGGVGYSQALRYPGLSSSSLDLILCRFVSSQCSSWLQASASRVYPNPTRYTDAAPESKLCCAPAYHSTSGKRHLTSYPCVSALRTYFFPGVPARTCSACATAVRSDGDAVHENISLSPGASSQR